MKTLEELVAYFNEANLDASARDIQLAFILSTYSRRGYNKTHTCKSLGVTIRTTQRLLAKGFNILGKPDPRTGVES